MRRAATDEDYHLSAKTRIPPAARTRLIFEVPTRGGTVAWRSPHAPGT
jgi:hypothetical protein